MMGIVSWSLIVTKQKCYWWARFWPLEIVCLFWMMQHSPWDHRLQLGNILDLALLLERQMLHVAKSMVTYLWLVCRLCPFQQTSGLAIINLCPHHLQNTLLSVMHSVEMPLMFQKHLVTQNVVARLLTADTSQEHVTPVLRPLHWSQFPGSI